MSALTFDNPVFTAYAIAASIMILKMASMSWLTVYRMMRVNGGFRNPEDANPGLANKEPRPGQLDRDDYVERTRRIHQNDYENVPPFLVVGLLFVLTAPGLALAQALFYGYVASRLLHFTAYVTARSHEVRATFWTVGSLIMIGMAIATLRAALLA
jgi:glutathione S-transferase